MNCKQQCFGCHGFYGDGDIASEKRSIFILWPCLKPKCWRHGKLYKTLPCWECSLCRVLGYTSKYDGMRNSGWCLLQFIKPHKTAPMFIQERGEKLIERFSLRFSYFSYPFISSTSNYVNITLFEKVLTSCRQHFTVHCKHKREKDTSWHQWICFFFPDIKAVSQYLCFVEHIVGSTFQYITVSCCILLQVDLT